jgi:hypothetical protein
MEAEGFRQIDVRIIADVTPAHRERVEFSIVSLLRENGPPVRPRFAMPMRSEVLYQALMEDDSLLTGTRLLRFISRLIAGPENA